MIIFYIYLQISCKKLIQNAISTRYYRNFQFIISY